MLRGLLFDAEFSDRNSVRTTHPSLHRAKQLRADLPKFAAAGTNPVPKNAVRPVRDKNCAAWKSAHDPTMQAAASNAANLVPPPAPPGHLSRCARAIPPPPRA